jgi:hypothetical protein
LRQNLRQILAANLAAGALWKDPRVAGRLWFRVCKYKPELFQLRFAKQTLKLFQQGWKVQTLKIFSTQDL